MMRPTHITRESWEGLTPKQQWDCIVALRGMDCDPSMGIKWFTTSVIRSVMGKIMRTGGLISSLPFVMLPRQSGKIFRVGEREKNPHYPVMDFGHFLQHITEAAENLGIPTIWVPNELWEELVLNPNYNDSVRRLAEVVEKEEEGWTKLGYRVDPTIKEYLVDALKAYRRYRVEGGGGQYEG